MSENYNPSFTMTEDITNLVIEIAELTGRISLSDRLSKNPKLRRENRIRSIHSSLAIEQNSLTVDQVSDILEGKRVLGPPQYVPELMKELFIWMKESKIHPLIKSCIFHYEFEFIHPFADGNGRTGRLWHTLILAKWKEFFLWIPIETITYERQKEYYQALNAANTSGESTIFVEFMLTVIRDLLLELAESENAHIAYESGRIEDKLLALLRQNEKHSARSLSQVLGISERQAQRMLKELRDSGRIERIGANRNGSWIVH